jgi:hypothetical protein
MAVGDLTYRASANLTVTGLAGGIASSATWIAGWSSGTIDNTSDKDLDKLVSAKFTLESAALAAGEIRVYVYTMLDDATWPDLFSAGTEGAEGAATIHDTEQRDSSLTLLWNTFTDTDASGIYFMPMRSVAALFGGWLPPKFALFVTHSTSAALETSGQQVTVTGVKVATA